MEIYELIFITFYCENNSQFRKEKRNDEMYFPREGSWKMEMPKKLEAKGKMC